MIKDMNDITFKKEISYKKINKVQTRCGYIINFKKGTNDKIINSI